MSGLDLLGADSTGMMMPSFAAFTPADVAKPETPKLEGASWFTRPVLGPVPGWGVAAGAAGLTAALLLVVLL